MVSLASPANAMPPPPIPLPRRPTIGLKRDSSYLDTDDEASLSSSTKKLKVAFSPTIDVHILDDWTEKSFDLVKEEVRLGIERHLAPADLRDDARYVKLVALLSQSTHSGDAPSGKLLKKYLVALDAKISSLGECGKLVRAALDLTWLGRDESFVGLYLKFLCSLATAHSQFIPAMAERLVAHFYKLPASLGRLPQETPITRSNMFVRVHTAIKILVRQVPSASAAFARAFKLEFPKDLATTKSYVQYQKQLLRLTEHVPELETEILALITQRLVSVDVQIQQDIEDFEDGAEEKILQQSQPVRHPARVEDSDDSDIESMSESEETMTDDERRLRELRLKVGKMDGTLDLLFEYYTPLIQADLNPDTNKAYQQLLSHFETFILPNRTRHAQFLIFHFSQTSPEHIALFTQHCLQVAFRQTGSPSLRLTSCAYLASFVARGSHIPASFVRETFDILCTDLNDMRKRYEPSFRGPDRRTYGLYYAVAQAILYIFCFRWRDLALGPAVPDASHDAISKDDLIAEGYELAWLPGIKETLHKNIHARLNLLKVCSPAIVGEFARIAHHLRFAYVFTILETNKRVRLGQTQPLHSAQDLARRDTAWDRKTGETHLQLEAYFPFDPYHLPKSKHWVQSDHNEWKLPDGLKKHDDDEDYDGFTDSDDDDESESDEESLDGEAGGLPVVSTDSDRS